MSFQRALRLRSGQAPRERIRPRTPESPGFVARSLVAALLGITLAALTGCGQKPTSGAAAPGIAGSKPSIVLISIDSLRADHLGCYGYSRSTSPNVDALAADGVLFENPVAPAPWTLPSYASLFTGLYPRTHQTTSITLKGDDAHEPSAPSKRQKLIYRRLPPKTPTLASSLRAAGYSTHAILATPLLHARFGLDAGFDTYNDDLARIGGRRAHRAVNSPQVTDAALKALDRLKPPFFLFIHYWDVHYEYLPPPPFDTRFDPDYPGGLSPAQFLDSRNIALDSDPRDLQHWVALYDGEIAWTDEHVGRIIAELKARGLYDDAIVIFTADHGDAFFEHGLKGHQHSLYQELLRVPLVVRGPGFQRGRRVAQNVSLVDLMPTLLEIVRAKPPAGVQGRSLLPLLRGGTLPDRPVFAETTHARKSRSEPRCEAWCMIDGAHKLIVYEPGRYPPELYDLAADPLEQRNLGDGPRYAALRARFDQWFQQTPVGVAAAHGEMEDSMKSGLKALGYLGDQGDEETAAEGEGVADEHEGGDEP